MAQKRRLAVLIDGENIDGHFAEELFKKITKLGDPTIRRVYGDRDHLQNWSEIQAQYKIKSRKNEPLKRKNDLADVTLALDILRLLHEREVDAFCIVSSDGGFAAMAKYIRGIGKRVYGLGEPKASKRLRDACTKFIELKQVKTTLSRKTLPPSP